MYYKYEHDTRYIALRTALKELGFNGHPKFYDLLAQIACTHADKNHDYAGVEDPFANFHECEQYGISAIEGVITRISDKDARFKRWFKGLRSPDKAQLMVIDESILDTLQDRAVYTLILMILLDEELK